MMSAHRPVVVPNTVAGQIVGGLYQMTGNTVAQKHFDGAFENCLKGLGWVHVSSAEVARREQAVRQNQQNVTRQQEYRITSMHDRIMRRQEEMQRREEERLQAFLDATPEIKSHYDEFEQKTFIEVMPTFIPNNQNILGFTGGFVIAIPNDSRRQRESYLWIRIFSERPFFQSTPRFTLILNGGEPVRFEIGSITYDRQEVDGLIFEDIMVAIHPRDFHTISTYSQVRGRVGHLEFTLRSTHLEAMRELASEHLQPGPRRSPTTRTQPR
jgi:hypothetical protein